MEKFKKFFLWSYETKVGASIWAMVIVVLNAFFGAVCGENNMSYLMIVEALIVAFIIGYSFKIIFGKSGQIEKIISTKSLLWILISFSSLFVASMVFSWFSQPWCYWVYFPLMILGMLTLIVGEKWKRERDC